MKHEPTSRSAILTVVLALFGLVTARAGTLVGAHADIATAANINLTADGTLDWAHWGVNLADPFLLTQKKNVVGQIPNYTILGGQTTPGTFDNNFAGFSWSDGKPSLSGNKNANGVYVDFIDGTPAGFQLVIPASTTARTLRLYVGAYAAQMHFEASLSDGSAAEYVDESFVNNGDGPNRVYTLVFAADAADASLTVKFWSLTGTDGGYGNVTLEAATLREAAPLVTLLTPGNGAQFYAAEGHLVFSAATASPFSVPPAGMRLFLNDLDVSGDLEVTGSATSRTATYSNLGTNQLYRAQIVALDNTGRGVTNALTFDTFSYTGGSVVIEAEDYNYTDDTGSGLFLDTPDPLNVGLYAGLGGQAGVDFKWTNPIGSGYRTTDVGSPGTSDLPRRAFTDVSGSDYQVDHVSGGDWLNYTRTFANNGSYVAYLRYAEDQNGEVLQLDHVIGDVGTADQTTTLFASFAVTPTGDEHAFVTYQWLGGSGAPAILSLSGKDTVRLTRTDTATLPNTGMRLNYLVLAPVPSDIRLTATAKDGSAVVSFSTEPRFAYRLVYKNSLSDPFWMPAAAAVAGDGTVKSVSQAVTQVSRFYTLRVE